MAEQMDYHSPIDRESKLPLYHQLYDLLRSAILRGDWGPGAILPSESELLDRHQVSRATVRQALEALVQEGLIYRQRGRGSFVAHPVMEHATVRIISFTEDMRQRGFDPGTEVLSAGLVPASAEIADRLLVDSGEKLARLERLRLADGEPLSIEISYLVSRLCPGILQHDYAARSLRKTLAESYNLRLVSARQSLRAIPASSVMAPLLAIKPNVPLLYIERVSFSQNESPVEYLQLYHRGDRYVLHNELRG
jgi:GntR family transcriptional regulator